MGKELTTQDDYVSFYRRAFKDYGSRALWNVRQHENPSPEEALAINGNYVLKATWPLVVWLNKLRRRAVSLSKLQSQILRLLAAQRDPESYVAGSTPLNRDGFRTSDDIDIFHDREERVARAAEMDSEILQAKGLEVTWLGASPRFTLPRCAVATSAPILNGWSIATFAFFQ